MSSEKNDPEADPKVRFRPETWRHRDWHCLGPCLETILSLILDSVGKDSEVD